MPQLNFEVRVFRRFLLDLCKNAFTCERRCWRVCRVTRSSAGQQMSRINRKKIIVKDRNYTNNKKRNTLQVERECLIKLKTLFQKLFQWEGKERVKRKKLPKMNKGPANEETTSGQWWSVDFNCIRCNSLKRLLWYH